MEILREIWRDWEILEETWLDLKRPEILGETMESPAETWRY